MPLPRKLLAVFALQAAFARDFVSAYDMRRHSLNPSSAFRMNSSRMLFFARISVLLLALALISGRVWAQEGPTPQLADEPLGPWLLSVWIEPEPPRVGRLYVTAALARADSGVPATGPAITIYARAPHRDVIESTLLPDSTTPRLYEAALDIPYAAVWTIELSVRDGAREVKTSFLLDVRPAPVNQNLVRLGAFATLVVLGVGWWFWGRHPRKKWVRKRIFMPRPDEND